MLAISDEGLVRKALANNKQAWLKLVQRYERLVYNYALRMVSHPEDARDLMQDVFISVFRNLGSWRGEASFKNWLMTIAHRRCIEHYRRRRDWLVDADDEQLDAVATDAASPEHQYQQNQRGRQLLAAMQKLPEEQRVVVEMKFFQQLKLDEIGQRLQVPTNTVKSRLYSAVNVLKQYLGGGL